jgi:hypothetical protein
MKITLFEKIFWKVFEKDYKNEIANTLHKENADRIIKQAKVNFEGMYNSIVPEVNGRFKVNLILASIIGGIYLALDKEVSADDMYKINSNVLHNNKIFKKSVISERNYTDKGQKRLQEFADISQKQNNPYDWKFKYIKGKSNLEYKVEFETCGILHLYTEWNIRELTPSMCKIDYDMAHMNNTEFLRDGTLFEGNKVCDCHYIHKAKK